MARSAARPDELATAIARRDALKAQLADADEQVRAAEEAARDAGRMMLEAALHRIKIGAMTKEDARAIANAIARHGGSVVATHLNALS